MMREIVKIDEERCDGCGLCVPACAEGAIRIIDGKARLVAEKYCDGLGACLGKCPQDAITIEKREAQDFDEAAVEAHLSPQGAAAGHACPSMAFQRSAPVEVEDDSPPAGRQKSMLGQWPVQLALLPPNAPIFSQPGGTDLLIVADCVPFAYANFHEDFLRGKVLAIGCPKLDDGQMYVDKLAEVFRNGKINVLSVAHMEVPCCFGLQKIVEQAVAASGKDIPIKEVTVTIDGKLA
ncbi:MAG: 4Fe-4S binding protein [Phycisphaerae bacterium]|nr:4Fe-4S binding protein [Phycisphaerae bacterium]